eukprot:7721685-Pyramimonas_sp.AAC.1
MTLLENHGLAYREQNVDIDRFAPHPHNRDGQGLDALCCHELLSKILRDGFSHALTSDATAFEVSPIPSAFAAQFEFQGVLEANCDNMIAHVKRRGWLSKRAPTH